MPGDAPDDLSDIEALVAEPASDDNAERILDWFRTLNGRVARGDLMLGILDVDLLDHVPAALEHAAAGGAPMAHLLTARWLLDPPIGEPDPEGAQTALRKAIGAGVPSAELILARMQWFDRRHDASDAERKEAYDLVRRVVERNPEDLDALHLLGLLTTGGFGTQADPRAGYELQKRAAEHGSVRAHFELYVHLISGSGVDKDPAAAFEHTKVAAEHGHPRALYNLGAAYARGDQVEQDMAKAAHYYQAACDEGNGQACATLAAMYFMGDGVEQSTAEAEELFESAEFEGFDPSAIKAAIGWEGD